MTAILDGLRLLHVLAGFVALFVAPIAMITAKGGRTHRRWGKVYYRAMAVVGLTAAILGVARPNVFLALLAVFSFYTAFSGYRALSHKRPESTRRDRTAWAMAIVTLAVSASLIVLGLVRPSRTWQQLGFVPIVFGVVGTLLAGRDLATLLRPPTDPMAWWYTHMTRMLGSYIAAVTAFSVVNFTALPLTVRWLWPTLIGTPLIIVWTTYYKRRFSRGAPHPEVRAMAKSVLVAVLVLLAAVPATYAASPELVAEARKALDADRVDEALAMLERAVAADAKDADALAWLGSAQVRKARTVSVFERPSWVRKGFNTLDEAVERFPDGFIVYMVRGITATNVPDLFRKGDVALKDLRAVVTMREKNPQAVPDGAMPAVYLHLGRAYKKAGQAAEARATWEQGRREHPTAPETQAIETELRRL